MNRLAGLFHREGHLRHFARVLSEIKTITPRNPLLADQSVGRPADAYPNRKPLAAKARAIFSDHPPRPEPVKWWKDVPGKGPLDPERDDWPLPQAPGLVLPAAWQHDLDGLRSADDDVTAGKSPLTFVSGRDA